MIWLRPSQVGQSKTQYLPHTRPGQRAMIAFHLRTVFLLFFAALATASSIASADIWISPKGADTNQGTREKPLRSLEAARDLVRSHPDRGRKPLHIILQSGTYYLPRPLVLTHADSGSKSGPVVYRAEQPGTVTLSGGAVAILAWKPRIYKSISNNTGRGSPYIIRRTTTNHGTQFSCQLLLCS